MNILAALLGEHGVLKHQIQALRMRAPNLLDGELRTAAFNLAEAVESHASIEDELLFVPLEASGRMPPGPVAAMRHEHRTIEELLARLLDPAQDAAAGAELAHRTVTRLLDTLTHHFDHEEHALFPMAARILGAAALDELGARWAAHRSVATAGVPSETLVSTSPPHGDHHATCATR